MTDYYCEKHNCKLKIGYVHAGTPYEDFDGYYCPECKKEYELRMAASKVRQELYKADREASLTPEERKAELQAEADERTIRDIQKKMELHEIWNGVNKDRELDLRIWEKRLNDIYGRILNH